MRNTIIEIDKNWVDGFSHRWETLEERIGELEDRSIKNAKIEICREKIFLNTEKSKMGILDIVKRSKIHVFRVEKELLRSNNRKWVKYFSKLEKDIKPQIQEVLQSPKRKNTKKTTSRYIIENFF